MLYSRVGCGRFTITIACIGKPLGDGLLGDTQQRPNRLLRPPIFPAGGKTFRGGNASPMAGKATKMYG